MKSGLHSWSDRLQHPVTHRGASTATDAARRALADGDLATTERICTQALAGAPDDASAWALLTETALQRGRPDAAIVCADRAVALAPKDPIGHILKAKCLFFSGETAQALTAAETAAQIVGAAPQVLNVQVLNVQVLDVQVLDVQVLDALGAIFGLLGRHQRAAELFRRAVTARGDVPQYLFNLAATERMTGMLEAAEAHCDAAIALDRHYSLAHYLRSDLRTQEAGRNHIAEMEALIAEGELSRPGEIMLRFALAKEHEDLDQHKRAFDHVEAGADLQRSSISYDSRADIAEIDRIIHTQTHAWLRSRPPGSADADPVFVLGLPRTGTTLVERIIASHSAMISAGETGAFAAELRRAMKGAPGSLDMADIGRRYVAAVAAHNVPPDRRFVDKTLQNYLHCGTIHAALPRAKIVLVQRRPLDACWAIYKAHFQGKFLFSYHQIELAEYFLAFRRLARHWKSTLPSHALLEVSYEDIVADPAVQSRRLIEFTGLPWQDEVLRFHESQVPSATASAVQIRRPIYASSVGKWRHHGARLRPLRSRLAREIAEADLV
jgi:tetratricopeptide (TPR) repeat protein